jgi:hypothetical protein
VKIKTWLIPLIIRKQIQIIYIAHEDQKSLHIPKGVIRIRKSKDRQHNGQKKMDKKRNNDIQSITHKTKD